MPDIELKRLRALRRRAERLGANLVSDLRPFKHSKEENGFRRKPDSESPADDVNVTTSCSSLMGLALAGKASDLYGKQYKEKVSILFDNLLKAPWMSSGLSEDNAFTTALVIRLFGFLVETDLISKDISSRLLPGTAPDSHKDWEPRLDFSSKASFLSFATKLSQGDSSFAKFLFRLFSESLQSKVRAFVAAGQDNDDKVQDLVVAELTKLISGAYFFDAERFKDCTLSARATALIHQTGLDAYHVAHLNRILLHEFFTEELKPLSPQSLDTIAAQMTSVPNDGRIGACALFGINNYPPSAAVIYWFVDGVDRAEMTLDGKNWRHICQFAKEEFGTQRSRVVAKYAAMMDPVAMAMSACLCARLRKIGKHPRRGLSEADQSTLPSIVELERSIIELFGAQDPSGIWPKYFPLFHYQDAGSNFCFTFEMLEAVLVEFGGKANDLLSAEEVISGLEKAASWCQSNRLRYSDAGADSDVVPYEGWNSGGNLETLRRGLPESWATAVVHMFLWELVDALSKRIEQRLLESYAARTPDPKWKPVNELLDIDLLLDGTHSLKETLLQTIVKTFAPFKGDRAARLRRIKIEKNAPISALLFGPPGTSKTEVAKSLAKELDWPLVEIDPSHFLRDGFSNIYVEAEKIFEDVMDMTAVVILFDEMDALVQKRDTDAYLDTESKFLTTFMLPKLAKLHDRAKVVFLMATNFQASFDDAVKRAGRFDFLLCMAPPTFEAKCSSLYVFFEGLDEQNTNAKAIGRKILEYGANSWVENQLALYTYGEFRSLLSVLGNETEILAKLESLTKEGFESLVRNNSRNVGLKLNDLDKLNVLSLELLNPSDANYLKSLDAADFDIETLKHAGIHANPAIKYILDRKQTRKQF